MLAALALSLLAWTGGAPAAAQAAGTVAAIQIHGNTITPDDEIRQLAGIAVGATADDAAVEAATERLRESKRFQSVQVLKRYASIADPSQVLLVIIVDEGPVTIERTGDRDRPVAIRRARRLNLMFLPILGAEDGYGLTYGVRFALPQPAGRASRIGFPLTWGGEKRAGAEFDKTFEAGIVNRITAGAAITRRTNPFFDAEDTRRRAWIRAERQIGRWLRTGGTAGVQRVAFPTVSGPDSERITSSIGHIGADLTLDTRIDPVLPRDAVYARAAWERIGGADRLDFDTRGYVGLVGQTILAARATRSDSNRPLPLFLKPLLGGMNNLRGFAAGTAAGDTLVATSAELLVPLTSPISVGRIGVSAFVDAGTAYDKNQRLRDQEWKRGIGGSVWFAAAFFRLNVAIAHGRGSSTRVHVGATTHF